MMRVYYLQRQIVDGVEKTVGSEYISGGVLDMEGTLRKLIQDTTSAQHEGLLAVAESWREATPEEIAYFTNLFPPVPVVLPTSQHLARIKDIDVNRAKPVTVTRTYQGQDYDINCVVTESVKAQFLSGDVQVGDIVIVTYCEERQQDAIVTDKVYKSW